MEVYGRVLPLESL
uniref:Uncharacterized protein n=1 Tax=Anguilla anguilla TaxID=7936 RepID=A0A0E9UF27_ANGAN